MGRLWIAGTEIDWHGFHAHEQRRRVSLPGYPFEGQKHWIKGEAKHERIDKSDPSEWFYVPAWRRSVLPFSDEEPDASSSWLLLEPEDLFSAKLAEYLGHVRAARLDVLLDRTAGAAARRTGARRSPDRARRAGALPGWISRMSGLPSYRVETWGCRMNVLDGERMAGQLELRGYSRGGGGARRRRRHPEHLRGSGKSGGEGLQRPGGPRPPEAGESGPGHRRHGLRRPGRGNRDPGAGAVGRFRARHRRRREDRGARPRRARRAAPRALPRSADRVAESARCPGDQPPSPPSRRTSRSSRAAAGFLPPSCIEPSAPSPERSRRSSEVLEEVRSLVDRGYSEVTY